MTRALPRERASKCPLRRSLTDYDSFDAVLRQARELRAERPRLSSSGDRRCSRPGGPRRRAFPAAFHLRGGASAPARALNARARGVEETRAHRFRSRKQQAEGPSASARTTAERVDDDRHGDCAEEAREETAA